MKVVVLNFSCLLGQCVLSAFSTSSEIETFLLINPVVSNCTIMHNTYRVTESRRAYLQCSFRTVIDFWLQSHDIMLNPHFMLSVYWLCSQWTKIQNTFRFELTIKVIHKSNFSFILKKSLSKPTKTNRKGIPISIKTKYYRFFLDSPFKEICNKEKQQN